MTIQPKFHWQFEERTGTTTVDDISNVQARLSDTSLSGHGRIGHAIRLLKKGSHVSLGKAVGQFGTGDFTIAFGMKNISTHDDGELDLIGSQSMKGHGNFFSLRLVGRQAIFFHVDENSKGKHYVKTQTARLSAMPNRAWVHVAAVRRGRTIEIYIDGVPSAKATSKTGIANIKNDADVKLGHSRRGTPTAQYEDLRIYDQALSTAEIQALIPPLNRPLKEGEIELQATDGATVVLKENVADLSVLSDSFKRLRVGKHAGATLYDRKDFKGTSQKCHADLPDMQLSKIKSFPKAIRIWSSAGDPFTGKWIIKAPNGEFLSQTESALSTAPQRSFQELFRFHYNLRQGQLQLMPGFYLTGALHKLSPTEKPTPLFVEELENRSDEFFITNDTKDQWLELNKGGTFNWTLQEENRALFTRVAKRAGDESQVGELAMGEVALYRHKAYHGQAWILSDSEKDTSGNYKRFGDFQDLNDQTSSIRLGPNTGVTLFKHFNNRTTEGKREQEIDDIVGNVPDMEGMQIGDEALSSIHIFRTISPEDVFTSFSTKLSQDYRMVDDKLEEFSSYRTILKFEPGAGEIELSATDLTEIEVEGETYEVDEKRSVKLKPNELNFIMITSEADGLNTPGLKIRTSDMEINERVVIFPNEEAHQQVANLEDGALWNAKDAKGNLIVDRKAHSKEEVASVQNTIKRVMGTVGYADTPPRQPKPTTSGKPINNVIRPIPGNIPRPVLRRSGAVNDAVHGAVNFQAASAEQTATVNTNSRVQLSNRVVSGITIDKPWALELPTKKRDNLQQIRALSAIDGTTANANSRSSSSATNIIQEV
ncbi:MAG: LamG domain-containing protein, partial [Phormidesmis sp.]